MNKADRIWLENALRKHYRAERTHNVPPIGHAERVADLAASAALEHPSPLGGLLKFAWTATASSPRALWAAPAAVIVLALALALSGATVHEAESALVASGPVLAAASLAGIVRARSCRMQELEASCPHNAVAVACARLAVFGAASLFALALACGAYAGIVPIGAAAAYALAPCLLSAAGGLTLARRVSSGDAALAAVAWSAGVGAFCVLLRAAVPEAYCTAAIWAWAATAVASALWLGREIVRWMQLSAEGGRALPPAARPTAI